MKTTYKQLIAIALVVTGWMACSNNEEKITPSSVNNLRYDTTPGRIVLRWEVPQDGTIKYIQVDYYNPLTKQSERRLASSLADSLEIPNTRQKYGDYKFTVQSISATNEHSQPQEIVAVSEAATKTWIQSPVRLSADMLYTNAQEPSEGPIANLLDDNTATFFHTAWSTSGITEYHYLKVSLPATINSWWQFYYAPRNNANNKPTVFDVEGSTDGNSWFLIKTFTKDEDGLPTDRTTPYTSERLNASENPFKYLKFTVKETNNNAKKDGFAYFTMSEFKIYTITLIDPEAPDEE